MKKILIPTDFSKYADQAIQVGAQIAKKNNCEIILIHMLELPGQMNDAITGETSVPEIILYKRKAIQMLEAIKNRAYLQGIPVTEVIRLDGAYEGITSYSNKNEIELIVMGSHGTAGIEEIFVGSNTEKVVRLSNIPVLVIKKELKEFDVKNIVFASDFSEEIKKPFQKFLKVAQFFNANINLVMICTPNSFKTTSVAEKIMKNFVAEFNMSNLSMNIYNDTNIEKGIINYSNTIDADLIGICTHGRTALSHFFNGSISEDLVNHVSRPVITFKI